MSSDWIDEVAAELGTKVSIPKVTSDVAEDLAQLTQTWVSAIAKADKLATSVGKPLEPVGSEHIRDALRRRFDLEFDARAKRVLAVANEAGALAAWEDRVELLLELVHEIHAVLDQQFQPVDFRDPKRSIRTFNLPMVLRRQFDDELARFRRLGSTLPAASRRPKELAPTEKEVWDLLEKKRLSAKELASLLKPKRSADAVDKTIQRIRKSGRDIRNERGRGYFRPDAPPPSNQTRE